MSTSKESFSKCSQAEKTYETYKGSLLLFLGEGNFSFSTSIALSLSSALSSLNCCLIATDYIPELKTELETLEKVGESHNHKPAEDKATLVLKKNVSTLKSLGHQLFFDVDATKLHEHDGILKALKCFSNIFIIFNFPHVKSKKMKIGLNRDLLRDFFMSCDNLLHCISTDDDDSEFVKGITPVVSLCAGQSGIPEVDAKARCWGDSWQVNDMAAHGNFVCTQISNFEDWDLFALSKSCASESFQTYQSSYYRLQNAVSFTTKDVLTFTYQHRKHISPNNTNRLDSMLKFRTAKDEEILGNKVLRDFHEIFSSNLIILEEIRSASQSFQDFMKTSEPDPYHLRPYHHILKLNSVSNNQISAYLKDESLKVIKLDSDEICVKFASDPTRLPVTVGVMAEECPILYIDRLLDLKYNFDYRLIMSDSFASGKQHNLYPHTHEFHISFWLNEKFTMDKFIEVILNVHGLMLKTLEFVEEYVNLSQGRKSTCWRIQVESLDLPLSRLTAHQLYLQLRQELADRLGLEVR
ncbi:unnamed protein product [Orchesella dallaii]|uniref:FDX-ACB domain-containing protein n=1 Tax=Orchesella dallaii TaxID=48710 RepID=A0ABP1Q890_9HEXA